jgi:hypothetical protein
MLMEAIRPTFVLTREVFRNRDRRLLVQAQT